VIDGGIRLVAMRRGDAKQVFSNEINLTDEFDEPYRFLVPRQKSNESQNQKDLSYMKPLQVSVDYSVKPSGVGHTQQLQASQRSDRNLKDLSYLELLKVPTQRVAHDNIDHSNNKYWHQDHSVSQVSIGPATNYTNSYNHTFYNNHSAVHRPLTHNDPYRMYNSHRESIYPQTADFEVEILRILYMNSWRSITDFVAFPEPNISQLGVTVGERVFNALRYDYGISFVPFLSNLYSNFREVPCVMETNRCFFLHLAVGCRVHPFLLQSVFRSRSRNLLNDGRNGSNDYLALELLLQSVSNSADFVDANVLFHLWPEEFNPCRVCFISDTDRSTIFSCFRNSTVEPVRDVIIHCDGSHFTLLAFEVSLDQVLSAAIANNNTVNFNEIPGSRYSMQKEIESIIR